MRKNVILIKDHHIAKIILNRPQSLNAMNDTLVSEFTATLQDVAADDNIHLVVITGNGKGFCTGGDLTYIQSLETQIEARHFIKKVGDIPQTIRLMEKPVVCMVNGVAVGAGFNIVIACDIVISAASARFSKSYSNVGYISKNDAVDALAKMIGTPKANDLMFGVELIDAETALLLGIVDKIVADDKLEFYVDKYIKTLLKTSHMSMSSFKRFINKNANVDLKTNL